MVKLDLKDRKILYELDVNCRQPNSRIAKKVGLSEQVVGFRIKRLLTNKVISNFYAVIDVSKLGYTVHKTFLVLQNCDTHKHDEIVASLQSHPDVVWVASCDGKYDLAFGTRARDMAHFDQTLTGITKKFGANIRERAIATILKGEYFIRDHLMNKKQPSAIRESFFGSVPEPSKLDAIDQHILVALGKDARTNAVDIAKTVKLSADAVSKRIKKMEKAGIIRHYNIVPNEAVYPYIHYKVLVGLQNVSSSRLAALVEYCRINPNIVYVVQSLGPWEFEIDLEVENAQHYRDIMMNLKTQFADILKDTSALQIYQVSKYNFYPGTS